MAKKDWGIYGDSKREQEQGKRYEKSRGGTADPLPHPGERDKRWKKVGPNKWREVKEEKEDVTRGKPWRIPYGKKEQAYRDKKNQDYAKKKGFGITRDKSGGFSMFIHKKLKGFEEGADMAKTNIDEVEGIRTVSTKGYSGSKISKPENRRGTKGFINFKGGKPAAEADHKVLAYHKAEAAKEGKVVQLRYRGSRTRGPGAPYIGQSHTTRGAGTGAAIYYKDKSEIGGRQRQAARDEGRTKNEEIEMNEQDVEQNEVENENEGGEQEVMEPQVSDLVLNAIEQKPLDFQQSFADLMQQRIEDAVAEKKLEIAALFTDPEGGSQYDAGDDEGPEDEEEVEVEEEPKESEAEVEEPEEE